MYIDMDRYEDMMSISYGYTNEGYIYLYDWLIFYTVDTYRPLYIHINVYVPSPGYIFSHDSSPAIQDSLLDNKVSWVIGVPPVIIQV